MASSINAGGIAVTWTAGQTYEEPPQDPRTEQEKARDRANQRIDAIDQFKRRATASAFEAAQPIVAQLLAMAIQVKALGGGRDFDTRFARQLREAADFLEDL